jgi:DNA-binding NarL/FixJ family response regulator
MRVLVVGAGTTELDRGRERADDLLGALARLADAGVDAVVVLGDLPDARAGDAVRAIHDRSPQTPVIVIAEPADADELRAEGAADVVETGPAPELVDRAVRCAVTIGRLRARVRELEAMLARLETGDDGAPGAG